jgi:hypothetical protein
MDPKIIDEVLVQQVSMLIDGTNSHKLNSAIALYRGHINYGNKLLKSQPKFAKEFFDAADKLEIKLRRYIKFGK